MTAPNIYCLDAGNKVPASNGEFFITGMDFKHTTGTATICFYNDAGDLVAPTSGTARIEAAGPLGQYHAGIPSTDIDVSQCGLNGGYEIPVFNGSVVSSRVTISDLIPGDATKMAVMHWRV